MFTKNGASIINVNVKQITRFGLVGVVNTAIDLGVLNALLYLWPPSSYAWVALYNSAAFFAAVTCSYILNKRFTYGDRGAYSYRQFGRFVCLSLCGLGLNNAVLYSIIAYIFGGQYTVAHVNAAKLAAIVTAAAFNYLSYRRLVFVTASPPPSAARAGEALPRKT